MVDLTKYKLEELAAIPISLPFLGDLLSSRGVNKSIRAIHGIRNIVILDSFLDLFNCLLVLVIHSEDIPAYVSYSKVKEEDSSWDSYTYQNQELPSIDLRFALVELTEQGIN